MAFELAGIPLIRDVRLDYAVLGLSSLIALILLGLALWHKPWRQLQQRTDLQHLFGASCVALMFLWSMQAGIRPGLHLHFFGVTALTLMFGWELALIGTALSAMGYSQLTHTWDHYPLNWLLLGAVPTFISFGVLRIERFLRPHPFIYIFLCGYLGAALAAGGSAVLLSGLLLAAKTYSFEQIKDDYLLVLPLILFGEGFLNGAFVTLLVALRPKWLATFDDRRYLSGH